MTWAGVSDRAAAHSGDDGSGRPLATRYMAISHDDSGRVPMVAGRVFPIAAWRVKKGWVSFDGARAPLQTGARAPGGIDYLVSLSYDTRLRQWTDCPYRSTDSSSCRVPATRDSPRRLQDISA